MRRVTIRMETPLAVLLLGLLVLAAGSAQAGDFDRSGPYLRGGLALAWERSQIARDLGLESDTNFGFEAALGFRAHPNFAIEAEYEMLRPADVKAGGTTVATIENWNVGGNLKLFLLTGRIQPYGYVGLGYLKATADVGPSSFDALRGGSMLAKFGGGLDIYIVENIAVYGDVYYGLNTGDLEDYDYVSAGVGVMLRF